ncbi:MAG: hypothetical protein ACRENX_03295 [Candidatus Dormibacteria bacterium]
MARPLAVISTELGTLRDGFLLANAEIFITSESVNPGADPKVKCQLGSRSGTGTIGGL